MHETPVCECTLTLVRTHVRGPLQSKGRIIDDVMSDYY